MVQLEANTGEIIDEIEPLNFYERFRLAYVAASNKILLLLNNDSWEYDFEQVVIIDLSTSERTQIDLPHSYIELIVDNTL